MEDKASSYPLTKGDRRGIIIETGIVNGRLVIESRGDSFLDIQPGTLVCDPWTDEDTEALKAKYGAAWDDPELQRLDPVLSRTVTRFGRLFHDEGRFTPRAR